MELKEIEINKIKPNPFQPRMEFKKEELQQLADNIKQHGMIEPIVVTPKDNEYMIVAGERRWRANNLAKKEKMFAIVKDYKTDADIKRDSLIENEMRDNLSNEEFKTFIFSLAESLGKPYYNKGYIDKTALTKYILGDIDLLIRTKFYRRLDNVFTVDKYGTTKLKNLLKNEQINPLTAARIARVEDKNIQNELVELAKHKGIKDVEKEVARHNFEQKAKAIIQETKQQSDEQKKRESEKAFVAKFTNKIQNQWCDSLNLMIAHIKSNRNIFQKFSHESRMEMMDSLKVLNNNLEKASLLVKKLMEGLSK